MAQYPIPEEKLPAEGMGTSLWCGTQEVALFRVNGELRAIDNMCPHAGAPLHNGWTEGDLVLCPFHGWAFDTRTGACPTAPGYEIPTFRVSVEDGVVTVEVP